jgi:hypothetical protein
MATDTLIPTAIEPSAEQFAARQGLQAPLAEMVDHLKQSIPGLCNLAVEYAPAYDTGEEGILFHACRELSDSANQACWERFSAWKIARYTPDVWRHFNLIVSSNNQHGG